MIHLKSDKTYYINESALSFVENDLGDPNKIAVGLVSGTVIMVHIKGIIDYAADGNYQKFPLEAYSTNLVNNELYYIYARIDKTSQKALVIYSNNVYSIDGSSSGEESVQPKGNSYYIKIGEVTATDGSSKRELTYDSGLLGTDRQVNENSNTELEKMFELDTVSTPWLIKVKEMFYEFSVKKAITLLGDFIFKNKKVSDIARSTDEEHIKNPTDEALATAGYVKKVGDDSYLSKQKDDRTPYSLGVGGDLTVDGDTNTPSLTSDRFVEGWLGEGGRLWYDKVTGKSKLEVDEIRARDVFETLAFRFNQVDVISGEMWNTFAFGTVKTVDTAKRIVTLDLVEGELMTVHVSDIMRGVFHHLTGGNNSSNEYDECGFPQIQGFSTSYFTPVSLLADGTGFRYALRAGTTVHPQPGMKFAAYGNFIDKSRQSSTYSTRTRLIMLEGVNTWVIDPAKHYQYVRGELNMEYGGMKFEGHGTIQKNSYIYGSQIFFTEQEKEEMKGDSPYSVNLSDYEGIINTDLDGNIVGGVKETLNVVTGDLNVTTDNETLNVVTQGYALAARIQAFKGEKELFHSDSMEEGAFGVSLHAVGCTAVVENGVLEITSVTDPQNCYVDMEVNCEGNAVFSKTYKITAVTNGYSPVYTDLDNEMDSVACDSDGKVLFGLPLVTNVSMFYGSKKLVLKTLAVTTESGVTFTANKESGRVAVTYIPDGTAATFGVNISVTADYDGKEYSGLAVFTVNKVKTSAIYNLLPSVSDIKVERDEKNKLVYKTTYVSCKVRKNDGTATSVPGTLPSGMSIGYLPDDGYERTYTYGSSVNVTDLKTSIEFRLYNPDGALIDTETIPVVVDGSNGESNVVADLTNEMDSVACDSDGNWLFGNPETYVSMYYGSAELSLDSLSLDTDYGINATSNTSTGRVRVTSVDKEASDVSQIRITVKATHQGTQYTRVLTFTVNKVKTSAIYNLQPSVSTIKRDSEGNYSVTYVSCKVRKNDGTAVSTLSSLPSGFSMTRALDDGSEASYTYGSSVNVTSLQKEVQFYLYYGGTLIDTETIPVVVDGLQGSASFKSTVFIRSNTTPAKPSGGSFESPIPTSSPIWSDGIPAGSAILWASTRIFSHDGKAPQQSEWTAPSQMTDTADFDVEFSSVALPLPPSGHPNTNSQWSNTANEDTIWMATSRCKNGVWGAWEVSKIKGEKGDPGTGINLLGSYDTYEELVAAHPSGNTVGDCYTVDGVLYVWDGSSWKSAGNIKGEPGEPGAKVYLHIKYSNDGGATFTANNGETPGKYIGLLTDYNYWDSSVPGDYSWSKFQGDDGNGIASETVYYLVTSKSSGITTGTSGWTTSYPQMTPTNKYLWSYTLTRYTNGTQKTDGPKLIGVYGDTGLQGCIMRMFENGITVGQEYRNDADGTGGVYRYIDHIAVENSSMQSGYDVYRCKTTHTATSTGEYSNTSLWEKVSVNAGSAFFTYLLAKNAYIKMLSGARMVVQGTVDGTVKVRGGMQGDDSKPIFWAGADELTMEDAPFRVMADGSIYGSKVRLTGEINATSGKIGGFKISGTSIATDDGAYDGGSDNTSYSNSKFFLHADGYSSAFMGFSAINKWAGIGLNCLPAMVNMQAMGRFEDTGSVAYAYNKVGVYIDITGAKTYDDAGMHGNSALYIPRGHITGFRRRIRRVSMTTTLTKMDSIVRFVNTAEITVTLPSGAEDGQEIWMCSGNSKRVNVKAASGDSITESGSYFSSNRWHIYIYDAHNKDWVYGYVNS